MCSADSNRLTAQPYRAIRGKRRRRRSEKAQFRDTLRSCAKQFIGGFESDAGKRFVEAMTDAARARGKPLGGGPRQIAERVLAEMRREVDRARALREQAIAIARTLPITAATVYYHLTLGKTEEMIRAAVAANVSVSDIELVMTDEARAEKARLVI